MATTHVVARRYAFVGLIVVSSFKNQPLGDNWLNRVFSAALRFRFLLWRGFAEVVGLAIPSLFLTLGTLSSENPPTKALDIGAWY
jgi:hypothetical protein